MRKVTLLLFVICIGFAGCNKDSDTTPTLKTSELKQTVWKGTLVYTSNGQIDQIGVFFTSEGRGSYEVISNRSDNESITESDDFAYEIDGKILYINPVQGYFLGGTWLLTEKSKTKLVFQLYPESESAFVITLNKVE